MGEYKADIVVNDVVMVEIKVAKSLDMSHYAQPMLARKATPMEIGVLLDFGPRVEFKRLAFSKSRKYIRVNPCESAVALSVSQ